MTRKLEHILCIDDARDILEVAQMCLETIAGFRVTCLASGAEAVANAAALAPDLILLDVMMPEMDGPATLKALRLQPALAAVPVIFMTARIQTAEVAQYLQLGAAGVIAKPFDPMALAGQVQAIFDKG